jgi:hypothetical protein
MNNKQALLKITVARDLLLQASQEFANHGCNDYELQNSQEAVNLLNDVEQWNVGPGGTPEEIHVYDPTKKTVFTSDWLLMSYLADRLGE